MKEYRNKVTYLSFVLATLIVLRHSTGLTIYTNMPVWLYTIETFIVQGTDLVVPVFFALSGFLFFQNLDWTAFPRKLKTRFKSLFVPYIIWNLLGFLFVYAICHIPRIAIRTNFSLPEFELGGFLYDTLWNTDYNITWFIRDLMIFIICASVYKLLTINKLIGVCNLLIIILLGYNLKNSILLYSVPFYFGAYFSIFFSDMVKMHYGKTLKWIAAILLLFMIILQVYFGLPQGAIAIALRLIQIPLIWIVADFLAVEKTPQWWVKMSFIIYVAHHMLLESIEKCFWIAFGNTIMGAILDIVCAPAITVLFILFISRILQIYTPKIWGVLNGGRN